MAENQKTPSDNQSKVEDKESDNARIIKAVSYVYGFLPQVAGSIVGLSAMAYFIGWRMLSAYYESLGAPWVKSLIPSTQIIQASVNIIFL